MPDAVTNASIYRLAICGFVALAALALHESARAAGGSGAAVTTVLGANSLVRTEDLDFGGMIASPAAGTATINPQTGARTLTGGVTDAGGAFRRGEFQGSGAPNRVVTLAINPSPIVIANGAGQTMTINQLRVSVNGGGPQPFGPNHTIGPSGVITFGVGGRLNVAANQAEGVYTGSFSLTMNYQ
jgi:hypothetical protein